MQQIDNTSNNGALGRSVVLATPPLHPLSMMSNGDSSKAVAAEGSGNLMVRQEMLHERAMLLSQLQSKQKQNCSIAQESSESPDIFRQNPRSF